MFQALIVSQCKGNQSFWFVAIFLAFIPHCAEQLSELQHSSMLPYSRTLTYPDFRLCIFRGCSELQGDKATELLFRKSFSRIATYNGSTVQK